MSDQPPTDRPQRPSSRRSARSRGRYSDARRLKSEQPLTADLAQNTEETSSDQGKATTNTVQAVERRQVSQPLIASLFGGADAGTSQRGLTPLSKQILLWGGIIAAVFILFDIAVYFFGLAFASTQAQAQQNAGIVTPVACLSYLLPYVLPFIAGWRATVREGLGRHGGLAGLLSAVLYALATLLIGAIINATQGQLHGPRDGDVVTFAENFLFQALTSFALGWFGGSYSSWQRRRAQRRQEQSAETVSPS